MSSLASAPTAHAGVTRDWSLTVLPGTTIAGSNTGLVYSHVGSGSGYGSSTVVRLPRGSSVAHATSAVSLTPSLPASDVTNPPADGDIVGLSTLSYERPGSAGECVGETISGRWRYQDQSSTFKPYGSLAASEISDIAVDRAGTVFISNGRLHEIQRWVPGASLGETVAEYGPRPLTWARTDDFGISIDAADNLYVADTYNNRVLRWTPGGAAPETVASLAYPTRIAVSPDGRYLYSLSASQSGVQRFALGAGTSSVLGTGSYPFALAVDSSGDLYVGERVDTGLRVTSWAADSSEGVTLIEAVGIWSNSMLVARTMAVDDNGGFYFGIIAGWSSDGTTWIRSPRVERWERGGSTGTTVAGGNGEGFGANQLGWISGLTVDGAGSLFVGDGGFGGGNGRVQRWTAGAEEGTTVAGIAGSLVGLMRLEIQVQDQWSSTGIYGEIAALPVNDDWSQGTDYEIRFPNTGLSASSFCAGGRFRSTGTFFAPDGKALFRNPSAPGLHQVCTNLSSSEGLGTACGSFYLDSIAGVNSALTSPPPCTITGTDGPDVLFGTPGDDVICGLGGDDRISSGAGNDIVLAGAGNDRVASGAGNDQLDGGDGDDSLNGGVGDDSMLGGAGDDRLTGGSGDDLIAGGTGDDRVNGGSDDDRLDGGSGTDVITAGPGADVSTGGTGADRITGGSGDDSVAGGDGSDTLAGSSGSDLVYGGPASDTCSAEPIADLGIVSDC